MDSTATVTAPPSNDMNIDSNSNSSSNDVLLPSSNRGPLFLTLITYDSRLQSIAENWRKVSSSLSSSISSLSSHHYYYYQG